MNFIADLHIHSRFSMATSKALEVPHLAAWAECKGIHVLGTGDFTHPKWRAELQENLAYDEESGFYRLKSDAVARMDAQIPGNAQNDAGGPFFCLQAEISSIYKRGGKTRKVHNLVYMPSLEAAEKFSRKLGLVGNLNSDGRPILGLDSHDLLEMVLETDPAAFLVPAHIWTPWFALFGSKSGFDRIEDCYGDLTPHIFALETGLSSDPPMNRCWSALDKYAMISNSDAHSGANLGREANLFAGAPSYEGMFKALKKAAARENQDGDKCRFLGTLEFYPEEGKYHLDGHRACNVVLDPADTARLGNICPVCGKPLTIGVLHRVMELADRREPGELPYEPEAKMLVPLAEVVGQILGANPSTKKVKEKYAAIIGELGPELHVLCQKDLREIGSYWEPLGEAVARIRKGEVVLEPGFDGQYGIIRVFKDGELDSGVPKLPGAATKSSPARKGPKKPSSRKLDSLSRTSAAQAAAITYSPEQLECINTDDKPVFVMAGPGAGKTRVLVARIEKLIKAGVEPQKILAITFTRRAAAELRQRLETALPPDSPMPKCDTLHGLAWSLLSQARKSLHVILNEDSAKKLFYEANADMPKKTLATMWKELGSARERQNIPPGELTSAWVKYSSIKADKYLDFGDLQDWLLDNVPDGHWEYVLVDEAQDLSSIQLAIVHKLAGKDGRGFFCIGDPDQSIYEFRGAGANIERKMGSFWTDFHVLRLRKSYRASQKILDMGTRLLPDGGACGGLIATKNRPAEIKIFTAPDEMAEARWIAAKILEMIGPTAHTLADAGSQTIAPGDIAVLVRFRAQLPVLRRVLEEAGVPCSAPAMENFWNDENCTAILDYALKQGGDRKPEELLADMAKNNILADADLLERSEAFAKLVEMWRGFGNWEDFFVELAWLKEAELIGKKAQAVQLLTIHASKGLEFEAVFLPGLEKGILPSGSGGTDKADEDNMGERRLLYVGITRAASRVFFSHCENRRIYGRPSRQEQSPFLECLLPFCSRSGLVKHTKKEASQFSLF